MRYLAAILFIIVGTIVLTLRPHPRHVWKQGDEWVMSYGCMLYPFPEE